MTSLEIRQAFFDFFLEKQHMIVSSAPMVIKNDPTLMFTNAGMNQFKDIFLGDTTPENKRIADTQKCLRVSGKHNDLDEVGHDTYHHTMFEMLGNWSFGDYFKNEAIDWAWEFLTKKMGLTEDRLYATVFEGNKEDNLEKDFESYDYWKRFLPENRILNGSKKDNFWEMGDTGPCGPCSEVHIDLRSEEEIKEIPGHNLVNKDHPQVIEIWNLVFIQYNRTSDGKLNKLADSHVDTGMGFERLTMAVQGKKSNYDTDIFQGLIQEISGLSGIDYGVNEETDIAMRVISDHLRAVSFSIADGLLPSNNKAGYVIRRILRRAIRYGFTFLDLKTPFIYRLVDKLAITMGSAFPELIAQKSLIENVIQEEELSFLRTLETGIKRLEQIMINLKKESYHVVNGAEAFELYDTYGFPFDLTELILKENGLTVSKREFDQEMNSQKERSRNAASQETKDWVIVSEDSLEEFIGYDHMTSDVQIVKYRKVKQKTKEFFQLVFRYTPFYAESGGQVGDKGYIENNDERIFIQDTLKENNITIHIVDKLPKDLNSNFRAVVSEARYATARNHSATHLLHYALRSILREHVEQKGSLVDAEHLRFDFAHFQKLTEEEITQVEKMVNTLIRSNFKLDERRELPMSEAIGMGAMALFGEKYGDLVRVIKFGDSVELCGGIHVQATGSIGFFKIISESAIASGIRRIEGVTGDNAEDFVYDKINTLHQISSFFKNSDRLVQSVENILSENTLLAKKLEIFRKEKLSVLKSQLLNSVREVNGINILIEEVSLDSADEIKDLCFQMKDKVDNLFMVAGSSIDGKASLSIMISNNLVEERQFDAGKLVREFAKEIKGGGGGQPFFATAGGKDVNGIPAALKKAYEFISKQ